MEEKLKLFKAFWAKNYAYLSLDMDDDEITTYLQSEHSIARAADLISDKLLNEGMADCQE
jgi:hypothetical protein